MTKPIVAEMPVSAEKFTRDDARSLFAASLNYSVLTGANVQRLRTLINRCMIKSGVMNGTFRCRQRAIVRDDYASIACKSFYFDNREVVTFNRDGFIGFAGWSDDKNVQPILAGFKAWVEELTAARRERAA